MTGPLLHLLQLLQLCIDNQQKTTSIELFSHVNFLLLKFAQLSENSELILANIFQILSVLPGYEDLAR